MAMQRELFRNALKKPCTLIYPFEKVEPPEGLRGKHEFDPEKCIGCGLCARVCPSFAIELEGGPGPKCTGLKVDLGKCLFCQECENVCPRDAIRLTSEYELAVIRKEDQVLHFERPPPEPKEPKKEE
ncbi:4Fe-4S dicluster domain-containing protein [Candidatus Bathyarchaeota archaeon]|nr:4Fe-4S dicluster domain-containing protein [Candidatus Bathyarchaeota archaeon]